MSDGQRLGGVMTDPAAFFCFTTWRHRGKEKAAVTLARLESNPEAREGTKKELKFVFRLSCDSTIEVGDGYAGSARQ